MHGFTPVCWWTFVTSRDEPFANFAIAFRASVQTQSELAVVSFLLTFGRFSGKTGYATRGFREYYNLCSKKTFEARASTTQGYDRIDKCFE